METENYIVESMVQDEDLVIKWEEKEYGVHVLEQYIPVIPCRIKAGPILSFVREQTDDSDRTQYDLYAEVQDYDGKPTVYGVGINLYSKQCDLRIRDLMIQYRS
jgi:hypothetical protein